MFDATAAVLLSLQLRGGTPQAGERESGMPDDSTRHENTSMFTPLCVISGCLLIWDWDYHALLIERRRQPWEARRQLLCLKGPRSVVWVAAAPEVAERGAVMPSPTVWVRLYGQLGLSRRSQ